MILGIFVEFDDETDGSWLRDRIVPLIEEEVEEQKERLDSVKVEVWWSMGSTADLMQDLG